MLIWVLVALALAGTMLNVLHDRRGFWLWGFSNAGFTGLHAAHGEWTQATMFAIYLLLALWGAWSWGR